MAKTRTMAEINKDYKVCKMYVDKHPSVSSLKEIADAVGLSESQVKTSLSRHPRVFNGINNQIAENQEKIKAQKLAQKEAEKEAKRKAKQETLEAKKKAEAEAKRKAEQEALEAKKKAETESKRSVDFIGFVIDASITGIDGLQDIINKICATKSKIVLTSVTIKELEKMQKYNDTDGKDARRILALAAGNYDNFACVLINETLETPDDCIIKYCADNKNNVVLLTSDKTMELKARTFGVKTHFFKQTKNAPATTTRHAYNSTTRGSTLYAARRVGGKLFISDFGNEFKSLRVISNGIEYNSGVAELKIGDDVYVATKKADYMTFAHYKITSLYVENNCKLVYSRRLYDMSGINDLPEAGYRSFMRDFKRKVD